MVGEGGREVEDEAKKFEWRLVRQGKVALLVRAEQTPY